MNKKEIIESISKKANGEIYLGVVGAVRTGKSTFIKKFIETLVVPNIEDEYEKKRCLDEIPQCAKGRQIMTIEPKFVPSDGAVIKIDGFTTNIKLIDCVGYVTPESKGYLDETGNPRMVKTPWFIEDLPFIEAAEIGTEKVIKDHATIGVVVTTDGSIGEISRQSYVEAEEKVINELKQINKPFIVIMNTIHPNNEDTQNIVRDLKEKYEIPVIPMSVIDMREEDVYNILREALYEFPVEDIEIKIPEWISVLDKTHIVKQSFINAMKESVVSVNKLRDINNINLNFEENEYISNSFISNLNTNTGEVTITLEAKDSLFKDILRETMGSSIDSKAQLLKMVKDYKDGKNEYSNFKDALAQVYKTGYGIATPKLSDMKLEKPEIIKQGGRYGVKLKAIASSIHMIKVDVESSFEPIIGSEVQSKELINSLMKEEESDPESIWRSEIFGRSLQVIVEEGIQAKLALMPDNLRYKLCQTITRIVNKGSNKLIAIVI